MLADENPHKTELVVYALHGCADEIDRLRDALIGIFRGAPKMSHAHLTAAAALDLIDPDGIVRRKP